MSSLKIRTKSVEREEGNRLAAGAIQQQLGGPGSPHAYGSIGSPKAGTHGAFAQAGPQVKAEREDDIITHFAPTTGNGRAAGAGQPGKNPRRPAHPTQPPAPSCWASLFCCFPAHPEYDGAAAEGETEAEAHPVAARRASASAGPRYSGKPSLPPLLDMDRGKKTLVLDLDETLVHSTFTPVPNPDYVIPVEIDNKIQDVYVRKRPYVDEFMAAVGRTFEVVVFTASLAKYADPLLDQLDVTRTIRTRLFRESCVPCEGNYVKDLARLGRPMQNVIIVDNSPHSYMFQPECAVPISTFVGEPDDHALPELLAQLNSLIDEQDIRKGVTRIVASLPPNYGGY